MDLIQDCRLITRAGNLWHECKGKIIDVHLFFLLLLVPTATEILESGGLPASPRQLVTDVVVTAVVCFLVWRLYRAHLEIVEASETDALTGLANRRRFDVDLTREVARAQRQDTSLVLANIDVDRFKSINDRFGHEAGDQVLAEIALILHSNLRKNVDTCYRTGGDEFAVLLSAKDRDGALRARQRLRDVAAEAVQRLDIYGSGLSIGIAELEHEETPSDFRMRADRLMYQEK